MKKMLFSLLAVAICAGLCAAATRNINVTGTTVDRKGENPLNLMTQTTEFTVSYADAGQAAAAKVEKLPLYNGKSWAFSTRWDDSNQAHYRMHELMTRYGYKGTFYLNSAYRGKVMPPFMPHFAKDLCKNGCSVGGHSMTHPRLAEIPRNAMFREVAKIRLELEAAADYPVNSFAFPYGNYRIASDPAAHSDIAEALFRTGYHHNTYSGFIKPEAGVSPNAVSCVFNILPGDRNTKAENFDRYIAKAQQNTDAQQQNPCMTLGIHVWMKGKDWDEMEAGLKKYAANPDWWYCNQNEYAAYRYRFFHSVLEKVRQDGNKVTYRLTLPSARYAGAAVPLTFAAPGAVSVNGKDCELVKSGNRTLIDVGSASAAVLPQKIDALETVDGRAISLAPDGKRDLPELTMFLYYDAKAGTLTLKAENSGTTAAEHLTARLGLPLAYPGDDHNFELGELAPGSSSSYVFKLPELRHDPVYAADKQFFFVQTDFDLAGIPARIYAATESEPEPPAR